MFPTDSIYIKLSLNKLGIDEIRAIPWVSSWVQTRYNISGWFGIGRKINEIMELSTFLQNISDN